VESGSLVEAMAAQPLGLTPLVDAFLSNLHAEVAELVGVADADEVAAALVAVERELRGASAAAVDLVADADWRALFMLDGHRSVKGWVAATVRLPYADVCRRVRMGRLFRRFPDVADLLRTGRMGVPQAAELARAAANPRCGDRFDGVIDELVDSALHDDFDTFQVVVREWERLADEDGAHRGAEAAHEARRAGFAAVGDTAVLSGLFGVMQGEAMARILDGYTQAEFAADWDEAVRRFGPDPTPAQLARTAAQRRADALFAIFLAAAAHEGDGVTVDPTVSIIVDQETFERQLSSLLGADAGQDPDRGGPHPGPNEERIGATCRTVGGWPVDPVDAVAAAILGHVRRVVVGGDGVIIDLGRRRRLFTGSARDAAILQAALDRMGRCIWPGCRLSNIQIDHATDWQHHGPTDVANSSPLCGHHNRFKTRGYTTRRDPHGRWHTHRPNGTEITPT
jgi:hypothetical protein